jgi:hypothetical protein
MTIASYDTQVCDGRHEAVLLDRTRRECYDATSSRFRPFCEADRYRRPVLDEQHLAAGGPRPRWPDDAPFAVCLTHDVDNVAWHRPLMHLRRMRNQFVPAIGRCDRRAMRGLRSTAVALCESLVRSRCADPLLCYERWLEMEAAIGARSTFLFLPDRYGKPHHSDGGYCYSDPVVFDGRSCTVGQMMREIHRRGWEVGLHASWHSFDSIVEMMRQKEQVEQAIGASIVSVRQHCLHFDVRCTPRVQDQAGLTVDSSIGFNDDIGFRYGTSYPWHLHDVRSGQQLNVLELPLVIQEKCLIRILGQGHKDEALDRATRLVQRVQAVGGLITLLWHPETIRWPLYVDVYRSLLVLLRENGAWFGTMAEVADWWRRNMIA